MIPELIIYLIKVNIALLLFYYAYRLALKHLTFYTLNRFFLLFGILFSSVYPLIDLTNLLKDNAELKQQVSSLTPDWQGSITYVIERTEGNNAAQGFFQLITLLFWMGVVCMSLRFIVQLISLWRTHLQSASYSWQGFTFRKINKVVNPFSFWRTVYLNPECHQPQELQSILEHEVVHVKQLHTLDVILAELSTIFYWFNPGVWMMKESIKLNLEYLTDHRVIRAGVDKKAYQYALLSSFNLPQNPPLVNNFHFLTIKKRIVMMNKKPSNQVSLGTYLILIPCIIMLVFLTTASKASFNTESVKELIINLGEAAYLPDAAKNQAANISSVKEITIEPSAVKTPKAISSQLAETPEVQTAQLKGGLSTAADTIKKHSATTIMGILRSADSTLQRAKSITYVDGKRFEAVRVSSESIKSIHAYKRPVSQTFFGLAGANGVININTKEPELIEERVIQPDIFFHNLNTSLIILNGKEVTKSDVDIISRSTIEEIHILKGEKAVSKYGERGRKGVVEILTKK